MKKIIFALTVFLMVVVTVSAQPRPRQSYRGQPPRHLRHNHPTNRRQFYPRTCPRCKWIARSNGYRQDPPPRNGYRQGPPPRNGYRQSPPPRNGYRQSAPPRGNNYRQSAPPRGDNYRQAPSQQKRNNNRR